MTQSKRGGARENAGRKPMPDRQVKKPITLYVSDEQVEKFGSRERLRRILTEIINQDE